MNKIKNIFDVRKWQKDTKLFFGIILCVFLLMSVCAIFKPSREELMSVRSPVIQQRLDADEAKGEGESRSVTVTYNNLYFINYCSYSTSGSASLNEAYIGFFGMVIDATADTHKFLEAKSTIYTLYKTDSEGNETAVVSSETVQQRTENEDGERVIRYYNDGVLIETEPGFTYRIGEEAIPYSYVVDKFGQVIASTLNGDDITFTDGIITINEVVDETSGATVASVIGDLVNYTYRMLGCGQSVLYGAKLTIFLTTLSVIFGFLLSIVIALGKISKHAWLRIPCSSYIFFFRGTPLMIQLFVIYFALPGILNDFSWRGLFPGDLDATSKGAFVAALIAFTLNTAAYCAEIVRAAIESIDKGQFEAGRALGFTGGQTMLKIIIPQSLKRLVPPIANEFIMLLKDASLVFVISLQDITTISKVISASGDYLVFVPALGIYLIITAFFTFVFNKLEARFSVYY